jgi:hypothetical protein
MGNDLDQDDELTRRILERTRTIAVVGASANPEKPAHTVPARMKEAGFRIIPVNPTLVGSKLFGERVRATLADIDEPVDMVDVFRRSEHTPPIAHDAVAISTKALWLQQGIVSDDSRKIAEEAGLDYVEDHCMAVERARFQIEREPE